jgi:hypothetical protein
MTAWWLLCVLAILPLAHAASYSVDIVPVVNQIYRNESALYQVTLQNFQQIDSRFQAYTPDPLWNVKVTPVTPEAAAGEAVRFQLSVRPTGDVRIGAQAVSITFKDLVTGALLRREVVLNLRSGDIRYGEYEPAIAMNVLMPYEVDPREDVPLRLELRNRNALNISNLTVVIESPHFSASVGMALPPLSERTRDVPGLRVGPRTPPQEAELVAKLYYEGELINQLEKNYRVQEYTAVRERIDEQRALFKTVKQITVTNDGNVQNLALVTVPTSLVKSLFVNSDLTYERTTRDGQRALLWSIPLGPGESRTFSYTENYRVLILLVVALLVGLAAYFLLRSPLVVIKEVGGYTAKHDGASGVKVRIFLRNRSSSTLHELQVSDRLPSLADVIKSESPGSIAPARIAVSEKKGTLLQWELESLEPYEERVLTYHARSKLKIIGRMTLPRTRVRFIAKGKERAVFSNNLDFVEKFSDK